MCSSLAYHGVGSIYILDLVLFLFFLVCFVFFWFVDLRPASAFIFKAITLLAFLNIRLISEHKDFFSSFTKFGKTLDKVCMQLDAAANVVRLSPRALQRL